MTLYCCLKMHRGYSTSLFLIRSTRGRRGTSVLGTGNKWCRLKGYVNKRYKKPGVVQGKKTVHNFINSSPKMVPRIHHSISITVCTCM